MIELFGTTFQNPVFLAAGTCGFGEELSDVVRLEALGGIVTKSVTLEPRKGNPAPRVAEYSEGMLNSVGLANPGVDEVIRSKLPWLAGNLHRCRVMVSLAGHTVGEYLELVERLEDRPGFVGFELNLSCPNDARRNGLPFALDPEALGAVVGGARKRSRRPLWVKLAPNDPRIDETARRAEEAGADGVTLVNTLPGLGLDGVTGRPRLGAGAGGVSGPGLRPVGVGAVARARAKVSIPLIGVGGILNADHARQYLRAGASLVQMGTACFADPRAPERVVRALREQDGNPATPAGERIADPAWEALAGSRQDPLWGGPDADPAGAR